MSHEQLQGEKALRASAGRIMEEMRTGLTYDDVLLVPRKSGVFSRGEIDTSTRLSRNISLKMPLVSANMDTVTESGMAIAMAQLGGIGIIHRFMTVEQQVKEVRRVKRFEGTLIENPITITPDSSLGDALDLMASHHITGLVVTSGKRLRGMLTARDVRFESERSLMVADLMTPLDRLVTAPPGTSPAEARDYFRRRKVEKLPLVDSEGNLAGLITSKDVMKGHGTNGAATDGKGRLRVGAAIGVKPGFLERATALVEAGCDALVVDIAHGHSEVALSTIKAVRAALGDVELIAGNVATGEGTADLVAAGVDAVKVGVGPGSICTTRIVTGSGVPQFTAILDCAEAAEGIPLIADGGVKVSGDITKALAAGASTVMIGSLLAGTEESPGIPMVRNGQKFKFCRGMASSSAAIERKEREGETVVEGVIQAVIPEGVEAIVPYRGSVREIVAQLVGGLRSGISYCGASSLQEMRSNARFMRITPAGMRESNPHDVHLV